MKETQSIHVLQGTTVSGEGLGMIVAEMRRTHPTTDYSSPGRPTVAVFSYGNWQPTLFLPPQEGPNKGLHPTLNRWRNSESASTKQNQFS